MRIESSPFPLPIPILFSCKVSCNTSVPNVPKYLHLAPSYVRLSSLTMCVPCTQPQSSPHKPVAEPCRSDVEVLRHDQRTKSRFPRTKPIIRNPRMSKYSDTQFLFFERVPRAYRLKPVAYSCWYRVGVPQQSNCKRSQIPSRKPAMTPRACWFTPTPIFHFCSNTRVTPRRRNSQLTNSCKRVV